MRLGSMSMAIGRYGVVAAPALPFGNHPTLGNGLVSYWPLDESSGTRADSVGANDLTDNNTVLYANTGPNGVVATFTAANSEDLSSTSATFKGNADFTCAGWVYATSTGTLVSRTTSDYSLIKYTTTNIALYHTDTPSPLEGSVQASAWNFIVFGLSGANMFLSVNGAAPSTQAHGTLDNNTRTFSIMGRQSGYTDGRAGNFGFWSVALAQAEITSLYNAGLGKAYANLTTAEKVGLVSYWNLDEASGNRADSHGSNTLTDNNTVTSVDNTHPNFGKVARFVAASSEYLSHASEPILAGSFTIASWVNFEDVTTDGAIAVRTTGAWPNTTNYAVYANTGSVYHVVANGSGYSLGSKAVSVGTWYLVLADWDGSNLSISINDGAASSAALAGPAWSGAAAFALGRNPGTGVYLDGKLGPTMVWSRVLTAQERTDLYNSGVGRFY